MPWVAQSAPADRRTEGISCHPFFFLALDLPGGIRLSLSLAGGKPGSLPQKGTEISSVMSVLKTQD